MNESLELYLYRDQFQLTTPDACYSDGDRYLPAVAAIQQLKKSLPYVHSVLVLGAGLGSIVRVMHRMGSHPKFTLVEKDKVILNWAMELLDSPTPVEPVWSDALAFMEKNTARYDLIFVDIFLGRTVPPFVTTPVFLQYCRNSLAAGGHLAFNYIINDPQQWDGVNRNFADTFPRYKIIEKGINRIFVTE